MNIVRWESPRDVVALLKSLVPENPASLLALGAGRMDLEGEVFTLGRGEAVTAVEWSDEDLAYLHEKYPAARCIKADLSGIIVCDAQPCEIVTAFDIIEHLPKYAAEDLLWSLRNGCLGKKVLVFMPVQSALLREPEVLAEIQATQKQRNEVLHCHLSLWTPEELQAFGFEVWYDPDYHRRRTGDPNFGIEGAMVCYKEVK